MLYIATMFAIGAAVFVGSLWSMTCSARTLHQRLGVLDRINTSEDFALLKLVSYDAHWRRLVTFRDPWKLYDPRIREIANAGA